MEQKKMLMLLVLSMFLLISNSNNFLCSASDDPQPNPVRDINGEELREGSEYYVGSVFRPGGGVTLGRPVNNATGINCAFTVVEDFLGTGLPISFKPAFNSSEGGVIRVSTDLSISFNQPIIICRHFQQLWNLEYAEEIGQYVIGTTPVEVNPGCDTLTNWFKIEEAGGSGSTGRNDYKFVFCPTVCNSYFCKPICKDVGLSDGPDRNRRLALIDEGRTYIVTFRKA